MTMKKWFSLVVVGVVGFVFGVTGCDLKDFLTGKPRYTCVTCGQTVPPPEYGRSQSWGSPKKDGPWIDGGTEGRSKSVDQN